MQTLLKIFVICHLPFAIGLSAFAQGSLTPPGPPAPTMKSADQIYSRLDPRTPISSAPFTISQPGSYYLTTNLTVSSGDGIDINTNGVTLDLNGFTIATTTTTPSGNGIALNNNVSDITIVNGHIRSGVTYTGQFNGAGFLSGISGSQAWNVLISKVSVSGVAGDGIILYCNLGVSDVVEFCAVTTAKGNGIYANTIKSSNATDCGSDAIHGLTVSDCMGLSTVGNGVWASSALNCCGSSTSGSGVHATIANSCSGSSSSGTGVSAINMAVNCYGSSSSGTGLTAPNANFCFGSSVSVSGYKCNMP